MKTLLINDYTFEIKKEYTILQFLMTINYQIPRFCYHEQLSIAGNCRMCLIEDYKSLKPIIACGINLAEGMIIYTDTIKVKKAREAVIEYLLINHPLDCPICDQGGECDLQDITYIAGGDKGRYYEDKRAVVNKNFGFLIKTVMNRCIHCTRCVRFATEVVGIDSLGVIGRGSMMEISFYIDSIFESGVSGNVIDLCPVGALTSKPYAFAFRPWELQSVSFIDIFSYELDNILIQVRGLDILRILPYYDYGIGEGFISDKTRFTFDSLKVLRLEYPCVHFYNKKVKFSWKRIFIFFKRTFKNVLDFIVLNKIKYVSLLGFSGFFLDLSSVQYLKNFLVNLNGSLNNKNIKSLNTCLNSNIKNPSNTLLINLNLRLSEPLLNLKYRKDFLEGFNFYYLGSLCSFNYYIKHVSQSAFFLKKYIEGKTWLNSVNIKIIFDVFNTKFYDLSKILFKLNIQYMFLSSYYGFNSWFYLLYCRGVNSYNEMFNMFNIFFNVGSDNIYYSSLNSYKNISLYAGHHKDLSMLFANIICPTVTVFEKSAIFLNFFQQVKKTVKLISISSFAKLETDFLETLSVFLSSKPKNLNEFDLISLKSLSFNNKNKIRILNNLFNKSINKFLTQNVFLKNSRVFNYLKNY